MNDAYFERVERPDQAYWLGFLAADGCIVAERNQIALNLCPTDRAHLDKLLKCLDSDYPVRTVCAGREVGILITSGQLVSGLSRYGVIPRKSLILRPPEFLPEQLWHHYWRGFFDGDGGLWRSRGYWTLGWVGTKAMMEAMRGWTRDVWSTKAHVLPEKGYWRFSVSAIGAVLALGDALYQGSQHLTRLDRKYEKYLQMCAELRPPSQLSLSLNVR